MPQDPRTADPSLDPTPTADANDAAVDTAEPRDTAVAPDPAIEAGTPNVLFRRGFTKEALLPGTIIVVDGYRAKDGSRRANGRDLTLPDGRTLFLGNGYQGTSMDQVAATAEVSKQTVYKHFGDKQELLLAIVNDALEATVTPFLSKPHNRTLPSAQCTFGLREALLIHTVASAR